jgi:hypothetical protein
LGVDGALALRLGDLAALAGDGRVASWANLPHDAWLAGEVPERPYVPVALADADAAVAGGASVQVNGIERATEGVWGRVATVARRLVAELGFFGQVGVAWTWSAAGARFAPHVDPAGAFVLQLAGRKRYRYAASPSLDPVAKGHLFDDGVIRFTSDVRDDHEEARIDVPPLLEAELGPGGLLYLAAGTLHATEALTESEALLFVWMDAPVHDLVADVLRRVLPDAWRRVPRRGSPAYFPDRFLADRLAELRAALDALPADHPEWRRAWNARIATAAGPPEGRDASAWGPHTVFERVRDDRIRVTVGEGITWIHVGDRELTLEAPWDGLLDPPVRSPRTALGLARALGVDPDAMAAALETLVEMGVATARTPLDEALIAEIYAAFAGVGRAGGTSWAETVARDDGDAAHHAAARACDTGASWTELVDDPRWSPFPGIGGFAFLDAIGVRYYLPPALIRLLRGDDDSSSDTGILLAIRKLEDRATELLDARQHRCIATFLQRMAEADPDEPEWRDALRDPWSAWFGA